MFRRVIYGALWACTLLPFGAGAYESDNFSSRGQLRTKPDATAIIDREVHRRLGEAVATFNEDFGGKGCGKDVYRERPEIFDYVAEIMGGGFSLSADGFTTGLERFVSHDRALAPYRIGTPNLGIFAGTRAFVRVFGIQDSVRMGDHLVGIDKLGHFFDQGMEYFDRTYLSDDRGVPYARSRWPRKRGEVLPAIHEGIAGESDGYGLSTTGVKSYGDLSANFQGLRFYASLLAGPQPYLLCRGGVYSLNPRRRFTFKDYVHAGWDEGVNCSDYVPRLEAKLRPRIAHLGGCPVDAGACLAAARVPCAEFNLSPRCKALVQDVNRTCDLSEKAITDPIRLQSVACAKCELKSAPSRAAVSESRRKSLREEPPPARTKTPAPRRAGEVSR